MCGVLGWIGEPKDIKRLKVLTTELFNEMKVRGMHATGYASLVSKENQKSVSFSKLPVESTLFTDHDRYYNNFWKYSPTSFIGHCRYSTSGTPKNNKNNHPFSACKGDLWMVHNGRATGVDVSAKELKTECDSERIIRVVELMGLKEGMNRVLFRGAQFACLFLDKEKECLYAVREENRPLIIIDATEELGVYLFSSTKEIFEDACLLSGEDVRKFKLFDTTPYVIYTVGKDLSIRKEELERSKRPLLRSSEIVTEYRDDGSAYGKYNRHEDQVVSVRDPYIIDRIKDPDKEMRRARYNRKRRK